VHGVIRSRLHLAPDASHDPQVAARRQSLKEKATDLLQSIARLGQGEDALTDPAVIAKAIQVGYLDAPHLKGNRFAQGAVKTRIIDGACVAVE